MKINDKIAILLVISLSLLIIGCRADSSQQLNQQSVKSHTTTNQNAIPVIFILIDSLMDKPLHDAIQEGRAPAMQFLLKNGQYFPQVVSSFPTMSVTVDSTLLTGTYADRHHVPGLVWYSGKEKRMIFYGNGAKEALKIDQLQVFMDAIYQLNQVQLNKKTKTIHEELADKGKESASINAIVFRGKTEHALKVPRFLTYSKRFPEQLKITGPKWFSYAALAQLNPKNSWNTFLWKKYGMNDEFSAQDTAFLINKKILPNVTITYFPENDNSVHRKGTSQLDGIEKADQALQVVLNAYGSWEQAVKNAIWIVMGDSAQSAVYDDRQAATVEIKPLLNRYRIAKLNQPVRSEDQIVISTNERMAYIYAIDANVELSDVVKLLQNEDKLDIIAMKDDENVRVSAGKNGNMFSYRPGGNYTDEYGQSWTLSGEPDLVDITINNNRIKYGMYPDVLARLYGAMHSHEGRYVVITVQPGYELVGESSPTHIGGGAHGSLHEKDSLVPLIISGTNTRPKTLRIVDIKDWILQLVNG
ncbi:alkaline phosphatase family protein [Paenibacillus sp. LHD-38]|uniref:alkaline phosphatase family protein n=1 Tax=Paenibacillus sp. LHD-38 TaxID=3072143 RepID=UPI00280F2104|nr:alkaline phosphatase family protein [Paenibacillus sp. LHD-38]MDQ8733258.1 alkaline phosphatase family protein [Paenibacillus sp. LHD-38]